MEVHERGTGWDIGWLRGLAGWACEQLEIATVFPIVFLPGRGRGRAINSRVTPGGAWRVNVWLSRSCPVPTLEDPRTKAIHKWLRDHPVYPLQSSDEHLLFVLGHELFHLVDPFSAMGRVKNVRGTVEFLEMERRCDECGLELVRRARATGEVWRRAAAATVSNTVAARPRGLAALRDAVNAARKS